MPVSFGWDGTNPVLVSFREGRREGGRGWSPRALDVVRPVTGPVTLVVCVCMCVSVLIRV